MWMRATTILSLILALTISSSGQTRPTNLKSGSLEAKVLAFFEQIEDRNFDDYLKRIRMPKVSETLKAEVLARVGNVENANLSYRTLGKLASLEPILRYHERDSVIEIKVISAREAFIRMQARAVILISEAALRLLLAPELQAAVAHELGHEYFWAEFMKVRQHQKHELIREIELRCDGIAVITLHRLSLDPANLNSAITKINIFNSRIVYTDSLYHPLPDSRSRFIPAMRILVTQKYSDFI